MADLLLSQDSFKKSLAGVVHAIAKDEFAKDEFAKDEFTNALP
jgi:hypothetical protein